MKEISSLQNPLVKFVLKLRQKQTRDESALFLIEGYREIFRALQSNWSLQTLFICEELFLGSNEPALIKKAVQAGASLIKCSRPVFAKIAYRDRPDGLLAIAPQKRASFLDLEKSLNSPRAPLFVIAEAIEKPGNLGTILRSSDAVGADGLIVCDRCTDLFNPNVVRASVGTLFTLPVLEESSDATLAWLKKHKVTILAATPHACATFTQVDLSGPVAIAVGTEQLGLSQKWMEQATLQVRIPMHGVADSLNVAMATTLMLYEALRQRS